MRFLLDTTVLIDFALRREPVRERVLALIGAGHDLGVSAVSLAEFYAGVAPGEDPAMDRFLDRLPCWDATRPVAMVAGGYRRHFLRDHRRKLATPDTLIAATARVHQAALLTNNPRDFPVDEIRVEPLGGAPDA